MAHWNNVKNCDIDCETVSFGTRQFAEANGSLYECCTLAVITPNAKQVTVPQIMSICCENFIYLAVDNSFNILSGESCKHHASKIYESHIDCFSVNKDLNMLILCFRSGQIFGLDLNDPDKLLFQVMLDDERKTEGKSFIKIIEESSLSIIIASSGAAYRLSKDYNISGVQELTQSEDLRSSSNMFLFDAINDISLKAPYPVAVVPRENNYTYIFGGEKIEETGFDYVFTLTMLNSSIKKMSVVNSHILCLLADGTLAIVCQYRLFMFIKEFELVIDDFVVVKAPDSNICNLLLCCDNNKQLMLVEYPSMKVIYGIYVKNTVHLINFDDMQMDIKFLEYVNDNGDAEIRVKAFVETCPDYRVQRLINRGRFDEAEVLIHRFNLNMDEIHKAKANLELKSYWESTENLTNDNFDSLLKLLDNIQDNSSIADCCMHALAIENSNVISIKKLLKYVIKRISNQSELESYLKHFRDMLLRLETFHLLYGSLNISWHQFRSKSYTQLYLHLLANEDCMAAAAVFSRHYDSFCEQITADSVEIFLQKIPNILHPSHLLPCLRHFIPKFVQRIPFSLQQIIDWVKRKTLSFEITYKSFWPTIGRDFCDAITELLQMVEYDANQMNITEFVLDDLSTLKSTLEELIILKEKFGINLSSTKYLENEFPDIAVLLLRQVSVNCINTFLEDFLRPRLCIRNIDMNDLLKNHIMALLQKPDKNAQWESKMSLFAQNITDEQDSLNCIIQILKNANLPWSPVIMKLYEFGASSKNALASDVNAIFLLTAIRVIQNKYEFEEIENDSDLLILVESILLNNERDAIHDVNKIIEARPDIAFTIYQTCLNYYLQQGNFESSVQIIIDISDENHKKACIEHIINMCEAILCFKEPLNKADTSFFEFLNFVKSQYLILNQKNLEKTAILEKIFRLKSKFNVHPTYDEYISKFGFCNMIIKVIQNMINSDKSSIEIFDKLQEFAFLCEIKIEVVLIELCKQTSNLALILECIRQLIATQFRHGDCKEVINLVAYLINKYSNVDTNMQNLIENNIMQNDLDVVYVYALQLMNIFFYFNRRAIESNSHFLFYNWICIGAEDAEDSAVGTKPYGSNGNMPSFSSVYRDTSTFSDGRHLRKIISLMINTIFSKPLNDLDLCHIFQTSNDVCLKLILKIPSNRHLTCMRIIELLQLLNDGSITKEYLEGMRPLLIENTLMKMAARNKFDMVSATAILQASDDPNQLCEKLMLKLSAHPMRQLNIATLTQKFQETSTDMCLESFASLVFRKKCISWTIKLKNMNLFVPDAMSSNKNWHTLVLEKLYTLPAKHSLLLEFCKDFNQMDNFDTILINQLTHYLSTLQLKIKWTSNKISQQEFIVEPSEEEINDICSEYINNVKNYKKLIAELEQFIPKIGSYDYEIYMIVLHILKIAGTENKSYASWMMVLRFLKGYTRNANSVQNEYAEWNQRGHDDDISPLAKYRMPFLCLMKPTEIFEIIKKEICVNSCNKWIEIAHFLHLKELHADIQDRLCQYAIKNTMLSIHRPLSLEEWSLFPVEKKTRTECYKILGMISDVERHTAVLYFVMNYSRPGADIVEAAKVCYEYALSCKSKKIKSYREKIFYKYPKLATKHILYTNSLINSVDIELADKPEQLISVLYNHPIVLKSTTFNINDVPDINKVVQQIADVHKSIDLEALKWNLINQWLQTFNNASNMDDSVIMDLNNELNSNSDTIKWDDGLLRTCYILKSYDKKSVVELLRNNIDGTNDSTSLLFRLRALRCLLKVCGPKVIEDELQLDIQQIQEFVDVLTIRNYLECIGLSYSEDDYKKIDKELLVQHLLRNFGNNSIAISLCVQICQNNNLIIDSIWTNILESLIKFKMIKKLQSSLIWLSTNFVLYSLPIIPKAWQCIIRMPFLEADTKRNPDQEKSCAAALLNLQCCPVADSLDLLDLAECCIIADRPYMAAALLPLANDDVKKSILKIIRSKTTHRELEENVKCLSELGILFVPQILQILKNN